MSIVTYDGQIWRIDWNIVGRILRGSAFARATMVVGERNVNERFFGPDTVTFEVDHTRRRVRANEMHDNYCRDARSLENNPNALRNFLRQRVQQFDRDKIAFRNALQSATHETMGNIDASVARAEFGLNAARFVRDRSVDALLIGAVFFTGPVALAVSAAGSTLRGAATYQDTDNVGLALMNASTSFVMTAIPIGRAVSQGTSAAANTVVQSRGEQAVLVLLETGRGTVEGLASGQ